MGCLAGATVVRLRAVIWVASDPRTTLRTRYVPGFTVKSFWIVNPVLLSFSSVESCSFREICFI